MSNRFKSQSLSERPGDQNPNWLTHGPGVGHLTITDDQGNGRFIHLSDDDAVSLGLELLGKRYDARIVVTSDGRETVTLVERKPKPEVGQFYRVSSDDDMTDEWQGNPIVKIVEVESPTWVVVEQANGERCFGLDVAELTGPLKVTEQVIWVAEES